MSCIMWAIALACAEPKIVNTTPYPWNDFDKQTLARAKKRCGELYPASPCVKLIKKYNIQDYSVVCGKPDA